MAEQENAQDNRRGKIVVDVSTQRALAARMMLHCLAFVVLGGLLAAGHQYLAAPFEERGTLLQSILHNFYAYALAFAILFPPLMLDSFRLSNRIVRTDLPPSRYRCARFRVVKTPHRCVFGPATTGRISHRSSTARSGLRRQGQPDDSEASAATQ